MYKEHVNERVQERTGELVDLMKCEAKAAELVHGEVPQGDHDYWDLLALRCARQLWSERRPRG
jgi:hypothetical protein